MIDKGILAQRQSLPLDAKILFSKNRIREWYNYYDGDVYVAFSGGKDSTVLLDLVRTIYPDVPAVFCDTGLEYPEIREFVKTINNVVWLKPEKNFKRIIEEDGYPIISKEVALYLRQARTLPKDSKSYILRTTGFCHKQQKKSNLGKIPNKYMYLLDAPFKISEKCCDYMKKKPFKKYEKKAKRKPFIGTMASDSRMRQIVYLKHGCNAFDTQTPKSTPLGFWLEEDVWGYIKTKNMDYCKIYDSGMERTGCMFCMFGMNMEKTNRFDLLKELHPKLYRYCMEELGLNRVLEYLANKE